MPVTLELAFVFLLVALNGLLAMSEIAVVVARKPRLRMRAEQGDERAAAALDLAEHPSRLLSTVQVGITLVGILAGAFGGATLSDDVARSLAGTGMPAGWIGPVSVALVVLPITYLNVVLGELVPKHIALAAPEAVSLRIARPMRRLAAIGRPVVWVLSRSTQGVVRLLGIRARPKHEITEEDLVAALHQAARGGVIERAEQRIVERLFRLSDLSVADIMTPRAKIVSVPVDGAGLDPDRLEADPHPRYVVTRGGSLDDTIGFVETHDLLVRALHGRPLLDQDAVRDPHWVESDLPALRVLHIMQASGIHIALVRGATGRVVGLVTLTDLLEHVVGALPDVREFDERPIVRRDDGSWLVDGTVRLRDLGAVLPETDRTRLRAVAEATVAELVAARMEEEIGPTSTVDLDGLRFEVVDMDWDRIDKVLVVPSIRSE
jgi:putative hemolysin